MALIKKGRCPTCKRFFYSRPKTGRPITGRPRKLEHALVKGLRHQGLSMGRIASMLGVSKGAVQYALKSKPKDV